MNDDQVKLLVDKATQNINPDKIAKSSSTCLFSFSIFFLLNNLYTYLTQYASIIHSITKEPQCLNEKLEIKHFLWFIWEIKYDKDKRQ